MIYTQLVLPIFVMAETFLRRIQLLLSLSFRKNVISVQSSQLKQKFKMNLTKLVTNISTQKRRHHLATPINHITTPFYPPFCVDTPVTKHSPHTPHPRPPATSSTTDQPGQAGTTALPTSASLRCTPPICWETWWPIQSMSSMWRPSTREDPVRRAPGLCSR